MKKNKDSEFLFYSNCFKIIEKEWHTENTYNDNFLPTPSKKGVYLIVGVVFTPELRKEIIYIGSSSNLKQRSKNHEVIKSNHSLYDHIQFYFKECSNILDFEKYLIKKVQPKYNTQWR